MVAASADVAVLSEGSSRSSALAWALGTAGALACAFAAAATLALGLADQILTLLLGYLFGILMGLLGALIASREPRNGIGWLMCFTSLATSLINLPSDYAYAALVDQHGAWPLGSAALWFSSWSPMPVFGLFLPWIIARFPDGRIRSRWRAADWLAVAGTVAFILSAALAPASLPVLPPHAAALLAPHVRNPLGFSLPDDPLAYLWMTGLGLILLSYVASAGSLVARFRGASHDERTQLKWFAYAGLLIALTAVYAGVAWDRGQPFVEALVPLELAAVTLPIAIGIAILRYRLFDIDLIINRTLVYATITAILGGVYVAGIELTQRLFVFYTGQKSDTAIVITAFAVATAFTPVQKWVEGVVERRLGGRDPAAKLEALTASVEAVTRVIDPHQVARQVLDDAVAAFEAVGGELYLDAYDHVRPFHRIGHLDGSALEVAVRHAEGNLGRLLLGHRRGHVPYSDHDRATIQRSAAALGEALAVGHEFGHVHEPKPASM